MASLLRGSDTLQLTAAPHRVMFFIGTVNVIAAMAWWFAHLSGFSTAVQPRLPPMWLHAFLMQYQVLPAFIFGFLLTVFPRWMALGEAKRWHYLPVGLGLLTGQATMLAAAFTGSSLLLYFGWIYTSAGWLGAMAVLARWLIEAKQPDLHARSAFGALLLGLCGVLAFGIWLHGGSPWWLQKMATNGSVGVLMPIYITVAHRVFPFFASSVIKGYRPWRPVWILHALWALTLLHVFAELIDFPLLRGAADIGLALLGAVVLYRWWPRGKMPPLLMVLFIGLSWWPLAMFLYACDGFIQGLNLGTGLGRVPLHALAVGCFGTLLVAMVTRVTAGHSGRPLVLGPLAAFAFIGMNTVAVIRLAADLAPNPHTWWTISAAGWLIAFLPWVSRNLWIYLTPRVDGRPG